MQTSLIISTYNWPEALELVLKSILKQSLLPNEVLIADDGSKTETLEVIKYFQSIFPTPLIHVFQEDKGFRLAESRNKAIAKAKGEYIIQIDGDCILHKHFIFDHVHKSQKNCYLYGSRVNLKKEYLEAVFSKKKTAFTFFSKEIKKRTRAIHSKFLSNKYTPHSERSKKTRGCNISFFRSDFLLVNGYNENFKGWGREDSELIIRFHNNGIMAKRIRYAGIIFHIWHNEESKKELDKNNTIELETVRLNKKRCINGIDKHLKGE